MSWLGPSVLSLSLEPIPPLQVFSTGWLAPPLHTPLSLLHPAPPTTHPILPLKGNKGGVSVRLAAFGHMLCFLNCHLPAHMDKAEQRKDNFQTILSLQQFQGPGAQGILDHEYGPGRGQMELGRG